MDRQERESPMNALERLRAAVVALQGLPILEWRDGYGNSGSLHFGIRITDRNSRPRSTRGSSIVNVWEASVTLISDRYAHGARRHPPIELRELGLGAIAGLVVERAILMESGSITLDLGPLTRIEISPNPSISADEEQWALEAEGHGTFVVRAGPTVNEETDGEDGAST